MANSVDPDQIAPIGAFCSRSTLFASIRNSSVMLGKQTTSADDIFRCLFFLGALRVKTVANKKNWCMLQSNKVKFGYSAPYKDVDDEM